MFIIKIVLRQKSIKLIWKSNVITTFLHISRRLFHEKNINLNQPQSEPKWLVASLVEQVAAYYLTTRTELSGELCVRKSFRSMDLQPNPNRRWSKQASWPVLQPRKAGRQIDLTLG